jgi:hypothetical protein
MSSWTIIDRVPAGIVQVRPDNDSIGEVGDPVDTSLTACQGWTNPYVSGLFLRLYWADLQPTSASSYDWSYVDAAVALAQANNRFLGIKVGMGVFSPPWLFKNQGITFFNSTNLVLTDTGNTVVGQTKITGLSNVFKAGYYVGAGISGPGIPAGAYIVSLISSISVGISAPLTANGTNIPITVTDRFPAPWDTNYQAILATFVQAFAARYDPLPNVVYTIFSGMGYDDSGGFCKSTADNATLLGTTYNGLTGMALWLEGVAQCNAIWLKYFKKAKLIYLLFPPLYPDIGADGSYAITSAQQVIAAGGSQVGLKFNNLTTVTTHGPEDAIGFYNLMETINTTNPVGLQMEYANITEGGGYATSYADALELIHPWFIEVYPGDLNADTSIGGVNDTTNRALLSYVQAFSFPPIPVPGTTNTSSSINVRLVEASATPFQLRQRVNSTSPSGSLSITLVFEDPILTNSVVLVGAAWKGNSTTITSVVDALDNNYTLLDSASETNVNGAIYYWTGSSQGSSSVTLTYSDVLATDQFVSISEFGPGLQSITTDFSVTNLITASPTLNPTVSVPVGYENEIIVTLLACNNSSAGLTRANTGWAGLGQTGDRTIGMAYYTSSSQAGTTLALNPFTLTNSSKGLIMAVGLGFSPPSPPSPRSLTSNSFGAITVEGEGLLVTLPFNDKNIGSETSWNESNLIGCQIQTGWVAIEKTFGVRNWGILDAAVRLAGQYGKTLQIVTNAGVQSPKWIYAAGAATWPVTGSGNMPPPWDPVFQAYWSTYQVAFAAKYDACPWVTAVNISGLSHGIDCSFAQNPSDSARLDATTYNGVTGIQLWINAAEWMIDMMMATWKNTPVFLVTGINYSEDNFASMTEVVQYGITKYGSTGRFGVQSNSFSQSFPAPNDPTFPYTNLDRTSIPLYGYQSANPVNSGNSLVGMINNLDQAVFLQVTPGDVDTDQGAGAYFSLNAPSWTITRLGPSPVYASVPFSFTVLATEPEPNVTFTYLWTQTSGPTESTLFNASQETVTITAPVSGVYIYNVAVSDGTVTNNQTTSVTVLAYYTSTQDYTALCSLGTTGPSVTRSATVSSIISQTDADNNALAAAVEAANSALRCDPNEGFVGWRMVVPNLANFAVGSNVANFQLTLFVAVLTSGSANAPVSVQYLSANVYNASNLPVNNVIDLSSYLLTYSGSQTFYVWPELQLTFNGSTITQLPSNAINLDYAVPSGTVTGQTVRFRDVATPFTNYQGYSSAYALTITNTAVAAVEMTLDLSNTWDTFSLNTHGWDDKIYGDRGYDKLVFMALEGTPSNPLRQTILDVVSPTYNVNDPTDFANNRLSFTPYFNGAQETAYYILRRARLNTDDSLSFDPNEMGLRFETSTNFYDFSSPSLTLPQGAIGALSPNASTDVVAGNNVAVTLSPFPSGTAVVSFPLPRFSASGYQWRLPTDIYTHLFVIQISGSPAAPTGIVEQYTFPLGDPAVLDGPNNLFLPLAGFDTISGYNTFEPFTAVFYSAVYNPGSDTFTIYPNSFPILDNPRTVNGMPTYTISDFAGYQTFPASAGGAITFSGVWAFSEILYNNRVNNGVPFSV